MADWRTAQHKAVSNWLAVATVTQTLSGLLQTWGNDGLPDLMVTNTPPDKARAGLTSNQLNLFLYRVGSDPAWGNARLNSTGAPNGQGTPPLALELGYMLTAYGSDDNDANAHRALARAMLFLHDHPVVGRDELQAAMPGSDLFEQFDRVRITPHALTVDEISKLWSTFQTPYRISVGYDVSVVLIDSGSALRAPLPVLQIGAGDRGPLV